MGKNSRRAFLTGPFKAAKKAMTVSPKTEPKKTVVAPVSSSNVPLVSRRTAVAMIASFVGAAISFGKISTASAHNHSSSFYMDLRTNEYPFPSVTENIWTPVSTPFDKYIDKLFQGIASGFKFLIGSGSKKKQYEFSSILKDDKIKAKELQVVYFQEPENNQHSIFLCRDNTTNKTHYIRATLNPETNKLVGGFTIYSNNFSCANGDPYIIRFADGEQPEMVGFLPDGTKKTTTSEVLENEVKELMKGFIPAVAHQSPLLLNRMEYMTDMSGDAYCRFVSSKESATIGKIEMDAAVNYLRMSGGNVSARITPQDSTIGELVVLDFPIETMKNEKEAKKQLSSALLRGPQWEVPDAPQSLLIREQKQYTDLATRRLNIKGEKVVDLAYRHIYAALEAMGGPSFYQRINYSNKVGQEAMKQDFLKSLPARQEINRPSSTKRPSSTSPSYNR